jgi:LacI family transcriptional regulator
MPIPRPPKPYRVALLDMLRETDMLELIRGVLDFAEHCEHWQFAGPAHRLFIKVDQLDPAALDGVIGSFHEPQWAGQVQEAGIPAVDVSTQQATSPFCRVGHDNRAIGRLGGEYLLARGFVHFAFIQWQEAWISQERRAGFGEAIVGAGRTCATITAYDYKHERIREELRDWLAALPKPVAIMSSHDHPGTHAIGVAEELGLRVPEDVVVLSGENGAWATTLSMPPMSSVEPDYRQVGFRAAAALDELMAGGEPEREQWVLPISVITRGSTDIELVDDPLVSAALGFVEQQCGRPITVEDIAAAVNTSRRTLENRMKKAIGQTPKTALDRARINRAKNRLAVSDEPMDRVARDCGYERADRFYVVFKRVTGMTPGQYRYQHGVGGA